MNWLVHTALGGGLLLLTAWTLMHRVRGPSRRQWLGQWAVAAALLLAILSVAPAWVSLPILPPQPPAVSAQPPAIEPGRARPSQLPARPATRDEEIILLPMPLGAGAEDALVMDREAEAPQAMPIVPLPQPKPPLTAKVEPAAPTAATAATPSWFWDGLLMLYAMGAVLLLARWVAGMIALHRLLRRAGRAPEDVACLFAQMATSQRPARLLVSHDVRVPFSCGLWRPTVILPAALAHEGSEETLRWVFAHELTHLARRDAWAGLLFGLAQAVYYYLPWFWGLRREVRLCQEHVADAAAARLGAPADYAQFLVAWAEALPPAGATGVSGSRSDLFRRIAMLLQNSTSQPRLRRRWALPTAAGLLAAAVVVAGLGAAPAPPSREAPKQAAPDKPKPKKEEPNKEQPGEEVPDPLNLVPNLDKLLEGIGGADPEQMKALQKQLQMQRKQLEETLRGLRGRGMMPNFALPGLPGMMGLAGERHSTDGRLGARIAAPSATLTEQLDLPRDQGVVVEEVQPNTPADKAGLKAHDILLELGGKPVPSKAAQAAQMINELEADKAVDAVVLRKGKRETVKGIKLPEPKADRPRFADPFGPGAGGVGFNPFGPGVANIAVGNVALPGGAGGVLTTTFRTSDRFTTRHQEGSLVITLTGKVNDGKAVLGQVKVQDGRDTHMYTSVEKVPEEYRDKVRNLVEALEKSGTRIEIKTP